jgi:hypothetical protein
MHTHTHPVYKYTNTRAYQAQKTTHMQLPIHINTHTHTVTDEEQNRPDFPDQPGSRECILPGSLNFEQPRSVNENTGDQEQQLVSMRIRNIISRTTAQQPTYPSRTTSHSTTTLVPDVPQRSHRPMLSRLQAPFSTTTPVQPRLPTSELSLQQPSVEPHSIVQTPRSSNTQIRGLLGITPHFEGEATDFWHSVYNQSFRTTSSED